MEFELKRWKEKYISDLRTAADDNDIARWMPCSFSHPFTDKDAADFVTARLYADDEKEYCRAIVIDGHACGCICLTVKDGICLQSAELTFWLASQYQRQGIMTAALRRFVKEAFAQLSIVRIFSLPFANNTAARCILNTCGFELEGIMQKSACKDGILHDQCIYALLRQYH